MNQTVIKLRGFTEGMTESQLSQELRKVGKVKTIADYKFFDSLFSKKGIVQTAFALFVPAWLLIETSLIDRLIEEAPDNLMIFTDSKDSVKCLGSVKDVALKKFMG